jgi:hypothetical protein
MLTELHTHVHAYIHSKKKETLQTMPCVFVLLGTDSTLAPHSVPSSHVIRTTSALAKDVKVTGSHPKVSEVSQDATRPIRTVT